MEARGFAQLRRLMAQSPLLQPLRQLELPDPFKAYVLAMATMASVNRNRR